MATKNDERIIELKSKIEKKKKELADKVTRFSPKTNCILVLDGQTYNLNTVRGEELLMLLIKTNSYMISAKDLGYEDVGLGNYQLSDYLSDIKQKLSVEQRKDEERKLKEQESLLEKLLSDDKKTELAIEAIAATLDV